MANTTPQTTIIKDSTIDTFNVRRASIRRCTLKNIDVKTSTIFGSILINCRITQCTLKRCSIIDSTLYQTQVEHYSMEECTSTTATLDLRKFAPKIRELIFQRCIHATSNRSPRILIALRSDLELYHEALRVFYKLNWFILNESNSSPSLPPSNKSMMGIRKLFIVANYIARVLPETLFCAPIVTLRMKSRIKKNLLSCSQQCVKNIATLKVLEFKLALYKTDLKSHNLIIYEAIQITNDHLGVTGIMDNVRSGGPSEIWKWEATEGKNLNWAD